MLKHLAKILHKEKEEWGNILGLHKNKILRDVIFDTDVIAEGLSLAWFISHKKYCEKINEKYVKKIFYLWIEDRSTDYLMEICDDLMDIVADNNFYPCYMPSVGYQIIPKISEEADCIHFLVTSGTESFEISLKDEIKLKKLKAGSF